MQLRKVYPVWLVIKSQKIDYPFVMIRLNSAGNLDLHIS